MRDAPLHDTATQLTPFEKVVEQLLREREAGRTPDPQHYLETFPEVAAELRDFFANQDLFDRLAPELAPEVRTMPAAVLAVGERVGGFELLEELGRGGMGIVYKARQKSVDRLVALKVIRRGPADDQEQARFRGEAEAIGRLQHPNIVQVFEVGEHAGMPFCALEYCPGGSLEERLRGTTLLPAEAATVVASLARAVQAAHEHNVVHRDLKPANVLLAGGDAATPLDQLTPKISDFGLARKLDDPGLTQSGVIMGTPSYMAPEQARGHSREVGPAADVYALGAVLYECLTGRPPFRAATTLDTLTQVLDADPVSPRQLNPGVPRDLETVILKCLHKEPQKRYADAQALADDLSRYLDGRPVQARRMGPAERLLKGMKRRPAAAGLAAALVLLAAGAGVAGWWYQYHQLQLAGRRARDDARKDYTTQEVTAALARGEDELKELDQALQQLLPDENHPLSVSVLLSDLKQWEARVQAAEALSRQARKLSDSNPDALAPVQKARLEHLAAQVRQSTVHYQIAQQLDSIRLEASALVDGKFHDGQAGPRYEKVFLDHLHMDMRNAPLPQLTEQTRASTVRYVLAAALDHWADVTAPGNLQRRLLEVARLADPDPWRDQVRDPSALQDVPKMLHLAGALQPAQQTPQILVLLARRLAIKGARQEAVALLRRALVPYPADFWLNFELGFRTEDSGEQAGGYRAALCIRPNSALVYNNLGWALLWKDRAAALACLVKATELDPDFPLAHTNLDWMLRNVDGAVAAFTKLLGRPKDAPTLDKLGYDLKVKGNVDGAIACFKKALELDPKFQRAHHNLGWALEAKGELDGAIEAYRMAIALDPQDARTHYDLGVALQTKGQVDEALACYRQAIAFDPNHYPSHFNLALILLYDKKDLDGAIKALHEAAALDPKAAKPHFALGSALYGKKDLDGAIREFNEGIALDPKDAMALYNLGNILSAKKDFKGAIACFKQAIALDPSYAEAHCNLGHAHWSLGQLADALEELTIGHKLGSNKRVWPYPSAQWVKQCETLLALDQKLLTILKGDLEPKDAAEQMALAELCKLKQWFAQSARFYEAALAADPKLRGDGHHYNAACHAALAAAGQGKDADKLSTREKSQLRRLALSWLRAELTAFAKKLEADPKPAAEVQLRLQGWQTDPDLADVRDGPALALLPEGERKAWQALWADVAQLLQQATMEPEPARS